MAATHHDRRRLYGVWQRAGNTIANPGLCLICQVDKQLRAGRQVANIDRRQHQTVVENQGHGAVAHDGDVGRVGHARRQARAALVVQQQLARLGALDQQRRVGGVGDAQVERCAGVADKRSAGAVGEQAVDRVVGGDGVAAEQDVSDVDQFQRRSSGRVEHMQGVCGKRGVDNLMRRGVSM